MSDQARTAPTPSLGLARIALGLVFASVAIGVLVGIHAYIAWRLVLAPHLPAPIERALVLVVTGLGLSILGLPIGERLLRPPWSRALIWPASVWIGVAWLLVVTLALGDLISLALPATLQVARARAALVLAVAGVLAVVALREGLRMPRVLPVAISLDRWPRALGPLRIVQLSDLHFGPIRGARFAARLTEAVNALQPDLVVVTGDLVDGPVSRIAGEVEPLRALKAPRGVYFVTGNHDMYSGPHGWMSHAQSLGWTVLANAHVALGEGAGAVTLAGVHDHQARLVSPDLAEDLDAALAGADPARPVVLLAHDPSTFKSAAGRVDLQISGHTHDGQIWPFRHLVRLAIPWVAGLYRHGRSQLYVSRGTGFWGPPMRLLAPAEITVLTVDAPQPPAG